MRERDAPGVLPELDTPALLFDLDAMERNLAEMAVIARDAGVALRPHTKTHKCPEIARMQTDLGARGITVAKLGEAEVMADAGFQDLLVAYPIVGEAKLRRLRALSERARVRVSLDSVDVAHGIGAVGLDRGRPVDVLVEVDTGLHRMGRPPGEPSAELVAEIARVRGVEVVGLLTHAGHAYRAASVAELQAIAEREAGDLLETAERCERGGVPIREISVGSTPTGRLVAAEAGVSEIRPGTYVFNDVQQMRLGTATEETCAARILATVVALPWRNRFVIDAGSKALSSDGDEGPPFPGRGVVAGRPDLRLESLTEEHGIGMRDPSGPRLAIGDRVEVIPVHVCGCVNLHDVAYGVRNQTVDHPLEIAGRGKVG